MFSPNAFLLLSLSRSRVSLPSPRLPISSQQCFSPLRLRSLPARAATPPRARSLPALAWVYAHASALTTPGMSLSDPSFRSYADNHAILDICAYLHPGLRSAATGSSTPRALRYHGEHSHPRSEVLTSRLDLSPAILVRTTGQSRGKYPAAPPALRVPPVRVWQPPCPAHSATSPGFCPRQRS